MKRRSKIKMISFSAALFAAMLAWGIGSGIAAKEYKTRLDIAQQRALTELSTYLDSIETNLKKSTYAGTGAMLGTLSAELRTDAVGAKTSLSALSAGGSPLYNLYKFLSQVGEYTESLNKKAAAGGEITAEDRQILKKLLDHAKNLSEQFDYMNELLDSGYFSFEELKDELKKTDSKSENTVSFISAVTDAEETMTDFPSLIYDGPFSDNILNKTSALLEQAQAVSLTNARRTAAQALGADEKELTVEGAREGKIAAYNFRYDKYRIAVTQRGGYIACIISDSYAGEEKFTGNDAVQKASEFLNSAGYPDMVSTYFSSDDGICTVNFAYKQGGYVCYPDLIKVKVSLSDGEVTAMDASDYIMNHVDREIPEPAVDTEQAKLSVAPGLAVKKTAQAVIPTQSGNEKYAYEFLCDDGGGQDILVYVDTLTGEEDDILILLYADGGTLTK